MSRENLLEEIQVLKQKLRESEEKLKQLDSQNDPLQINGLKNSEIARYSRQILLPEIGVKGQLKLKNSSVLIVGAGGLGCPSALYLAGAGVGRIGIVDYDTIELTNLHRQLLFSTSDIGNSKADVATGNLWRLNNNVTFVPYVLQMNSHNALEIIHKYDVIIDATDNVATRYLLNDACILNKKPLVSGSALQFEGQLTVYNFYGPCYRCIFPKPPPPETVNNCGDSGVLGAVVGTIGVMQALQALKIILELPGILSGKLLVFDALDFTFRNLNLRGKRSTCEVCGINSTIKNLIDYEQFCGSKANDKNPNLKLLDVEERISVEEYTKFNNGKKHIIIDVRSKEEFEMYSLPNSINIPFSKIRTLDSLDSIKTLLDDNRLISNVYVLCRRGNDSQKAVQYLKDKINDPELEIKDIIGGLHACAQKIDPLIPIY